MTAKASAERTRLLRRLATAHGLSPDDIATATGAPAETCRRWLRGAPSIPKRRLAELVTMIGDMTALQETPGLPAKIQASAKRGYVIAYSPLLRRVGAWDRRESVPPGFTVLRVRPGATAPTVS